MKISVVQRCFQASPAQCKHNPHRLFGTSVRIQSNQQNTNKVETISTNSKPIQNTIAKNDVPTQKANLFSRLSLIKPLINALNDLGHTKPTPIQQQTIKAALKGNNIVASAKTGTGKTGAYMLPALQRLHNRMKYEKHITKSTEIVLQAEKTRSVRLKQPFITPTLRKPGQPGILVLAPTRELVEQIAEHTILYSKYTPARVVTIFGGISEASQISTLQHGVDVLISTPGRLVQLLQKDLSEVQTFVVDECDRMLNMGFLPDIQDIFSRLKQPPKKMRDISAADPTTLQIFLFSATLVNSVQDFIMRLAPRHYKVDLNDALEVADGGRHVSKLLLMPEVQHMGFYVSARRKVALIKYILYRKGKLSFKEQQDADLVRARADRLAESLSKDGADAKSIHKGLTVGQRRKIVEEFKKGTVKILVATDIMARGIDIPFLPYVVNFDVPSIPEDYIHRIGRTGRAGSTGTYTPLAITLVSKEPKLIKLGGQVVELNEQHFMKNIEEMLQNKVRFQKVPGPWKDELLENYEKFADSLRGRQPTTTELSNYLTDANSKRLLKERYEIVKRLIQKKENLAAKQLPKPGKLNKQLKHDGRDLLQGNIPAAETYMQVSLRNFEEGRYESIVYKFQRKGALKRGAVQMHQQKGYRPKVIWNQKHKHKRESNKPRDVQPINNNHK